MSKATLPAEMADHLEFQISLLRLCAVPHLRESVKPGMKEPVEEAEFAEIPATKALKSLTSGLL